MQNGCTHKAEATGHMISPITVLGAGAWGTALAILLTINNQTTILWGHDVSFIEKMRQAQCNFLYLPEILLPPSLKLTSDLTEALAEAKHLVIAVPSEVFSEVLIKIKPYLRPDCGLICATKGLTPQTDELLHVTTQRLLAPLNCSFGVLAGPSFAKEVALGKPTAVTFASESSHFAQEVIPRFINPNFRIYSTPDVIGVEICGAVKNILAIAAGIVDGLELGMNALSALITRGLAEMQRLGVAIGSKPSTFMGLAGIGDLVLTCTGNLSRNRRFGFALAAGKSTPDALQSIGQVVEGLGNLSGVRRLAKRYHVEMPIVEQMYQVVYHQLSVQEAIDDLLRRKPKAEMD